MNLIKTISILLWAAVLVVAVASLVQAISGASSENLLAIDLCIAGVAGIVTVLAR